MPKYSLMITPEEYDAFKTSPTTRLYLHHWRPPRTITIPEVRGGEFLEEIISPATTVVEKQGELEIDCNTQFVRRLCRDLESVIDFGATSAWDVITGSLSATQIRSINRQRN